MAGDVSPVAMFLPNELCQGSSQTGRAATIWSFAMETKESHSQLDVTANVINPKMDNPSAEATWMKV